MCTLDHRVLEFARLHSLADKYRIHRMIASLAVVFYSDLTEIVHSTSIEIKEGFKDHWLITPRQELSKGNTHDSASVRQ